MTQECKGMTQEWYGMTQECKGMRQTRRARMTGQVVPESALQSLLVNGQQENADPAQLNELRLCKGVGEEGGWEEGVQAAGV